MRIYARARYINIMRVDLRLSLSLSLSLSNKISELTNAGALINSKNDSFLNREKFTLLEIIVI